MEIHPSVLETLEQLRAQAPDAPLLALGQTVFWDEPLKAALPLLAAEIGLPIKLVAGVHDTDYFAKLPGGAISVSPYTALPRNDGSTKAFWSAAGEFSALFGSETPVTRDALAEAGVYLERIGHANPGFIDEATEAWGWRGIASSDPVPRVTKDVPLTGVFPYLQETLNWAIALTLECLSDSEQQAAGEQAADKLNTLLCDTKELCPGQTLAEFYECLLPELQRFVTGQPSCSEITRTTKLLDFNRGTASLPRFQFVDLFLRPATAEIARAAYNRAVAGSETYDLDRFGAGAIPFDLVIPNSGRGTIRLSANQLIVMTPEPKLQPLEKPVGSVAELAAVVEQAFGPCALVGKGITLISMLASEFVFAFHEGASPYVQQTRNMHDLLREAGIAVKANPILRVALNSWDALDRTSLWLRLPEPLRGPFGAEHVPGPTVARTWRIVVEQQAAELRALGKARSPSALIEALFSLKGGRWESLAAEYESLRRALKPLREEMQRIRSEVSAAHDRLRAVKREWSGLERRRGELFGAQRKGNSRAGAERERLSEAISSLRTERRELRTKLDELRTAQAQAATSPETQALRSRRSEIQREAEFARLRCAREAIIAAESLRKTNRRPSAWWFAIASPDGAWFRNLLSLVSLRLEPLTGETS